MEAIYQLNIFELPILPEKLSEPLYCVLHPLFPNSPCIRFLISISNRQELTQQAMFAKHLLANVCNLTIGTGLPLGGIGCIHHNTENDVCACLSVLCLSIDLFLISMATSWVATWTNLFSCIEMLGHL